MKKSIEGGRPHITEQSKKAKVKEWNTSYIESLINNAESKARTQTQEQTDNDDRTKEYIYTPSLSTHPKPTEWKWLAFAVILLSLLVVDVGCFLVSVIMFAVCNGTLMIE